MSAVITPEDIITTPSTTRHILSNLEDWRADENSNRVRAYGKTANTMFFGPRSLAGMTSPEQVRAYSKWLVKAYEHAEYLSGNPALFAEWIANGNAEIAVRYAGIESVWTMRNLELRVKREVVDNALAGIATLAEDTDWSFRSNIVYKFDDKRFTDEYLTDTTQPVLSRALWYAKRKAVLNLDGAANVRLDNSNKLFLILSGIDTPQDQVSLSQAVSVMQVVAYLHQPRADVNTLKTARARVLELQAAHEGTDEVMRRRIASQNFTAYWDNMKTRQRTKQASVEDTALAWETIPLAPQGTTTSRTWGIEVETVRWDDTSRPLGWTDVHDGSLPDEDYSGGCECGCNVCNNGDHCEYATNDCYGEEQGGTSSRELVSPVLNHFNSAGLEQICSDLGDYEPSTAPGIHVHIGASDMTVVDIARLLYAYGVVEPLIKPLYHREVFGYCKEMSGGNVQWWMSAVKSHLRDNGTVPNPRDICYDQPADRYQDVNLHALSKHGTIEFRAMGPFYNYAHLVRWAWFVREMANVARLNLPQSVWSECKTLTDVIHLLRKYGSELPLDDSTSTNKIVLELSSDEQY